jgi:hypothetical protein
MPVINNNKLRGVQSLYNVLELMKNELLANEFCNNVTIGELTEIDLAKMTIFPLAHITINSVTHNVNSLTFDLTLFNLDIVNISKDLPQTIDQPTGTYGNDNLIYILTNQLYVVNRLVSKLRQTNILSSNTEYELDNTPQSLVINKEMENMLAGYQTTINITLPNDIDKC